MKSRPVLLFYIKSYSDCPFRNTLTKQIYLLSFIHELSIASLLETLGSPTYAELLSILSDQKCSKTELGARSSLDTKALTEYIGTVLKCELAAQSGNNLKITEKGKSYLKEYEKLAEMLH